MLGLVVRVFSKWRRAGFLRLLDEHLALARRASRPLSLLALDVDHLAYVNYAYGPVAGETALGMVATVLRAPVRQDQLARFGGDEFYALLPGVARAEALDLAEQVRRAAVTIALDDDDLGPKAPRRCLSFSLAVAAYPRTGISPPHCCGSPRRGYPMPSGRAVTQSTVRRATRRRRIGRRAQYVGAGCNAAGLRRDR